MYFSGYMGRRLRIDLSGEKVYSEDISPESYRRFIGGRGLNIEVMINEMTERIEPLSGDNLLILGVGALVGTPSLFANRLTVSAKSPLTGFVGDSSVGGEIGQEMKATGYDQVVISGRADKPVYLYITDSRVEFRDAAHLWGKSTSEAGLLIRREVNNTKATVLCIGPGGENLVRFANIIAGDHAAGRTGMGAVMGSKNIKAIIFEGSLKPEIVDRAALTKTMKELSNVIKYDPATEKAKQYGAATAIEGFNSLGVLEVRNLQSGVMEEVDKISGKTARDNHAIKKRGCPSCPINCRVLSMFHSKEFGSFVLGGPEFASLQNFGARIGNTNLESICFMTKLANDYGIDYMSFCGIISWLMECYEKGLISNRDIDGLCLEWGNYDNVILLMERITNRRGIGDLLAEGAYRASERLGDYTKKYLLVIKKMEFEGCDPRGYKGRGVGFGVSARGADNCRTLCAIESTLTTEQAVKLFGNEEAANLRGVKGKGKLLKFIEDFTAVSELLGLCRYGVYVFASGLDEIIVRSRLLAEAYSHITGIVAPDYALEFLVEAGERLINMERLFNLREGLRRDDDLLPKRFRTEPMPEGPAKGSVVENDEILNEYYAERAWNVNSGKPSEAVLSRLGILDMYRKTRISEQE